MSLLPEAPARRVLVLLAVVGVAAVLVAATFSLSAKLERSRQKEVIVTLRDTLAELRMSVDSCRTELAREETAFRRFDAQVDSLRRRVRELESLDTAGVPEELYEEYLSVFDRYNEAVPAWEARAGALRTSEAACRAFAERHNELADTLRRRVDAWEAELGL